MKLREFAKRVVVKRSKFTAYALNPNDDRGRDKAFIFEQALGFTLDNYEDLLQQIQAKALDGEAILIREDQFGKHLRVDLQITGPHGQSARVRTGWRIPIDSDEARLATLFVKR
jgi:hypothetical protein